MKHSQYFLLFIALAVQTYSVQAQFKVELVGGLGGAIIRETKVTFNDAARFGRIFSSEIGVFGDVKLGKYTSLKPGILFARRGGALERQWMFGYSFEPVVMNCIELPLLYEIKPSNFLLFVGPQLKTVVSASAGSSDVTGVFKSAALDLRLGFGFETGRRIGFRLTFIRGLTDVAAEESRVWKSHAFLLTMSYKLGKVSR